MSPEQVKAWVSKTHFDEKRRLVGLFKQGPLETNREFAERVFEAFRAHQAKQQTSRLKPGQPKV
jgi:hypothetical protein